MSIQIRAARIGDIKTLGRLSEEAAEADYKLHPPEVRKIIARRHGTKPLLFAMLRGNRSILVAEDREDIDGLLVGTPNSDNVAVVQWLYVVPSGRGKGIAQKLLNEFEKKAIASGSHKMMAWTEVARDFYLKIGWTEEVKLPNHWWGKDFSIMAKYLK